LLLLLLLLLNGKIDNEKKCLILGIEICLSFSHTTRSKIKDAKKRGSNFFILAFVIGVLNFI